jgi:hypothetical protein
MAKDRRAENTEPHWEADWAFLVVDLKWFGHAAEAERAVGMLLKTAPTNTVVLVCKIKKDDTERFRRHVKEITGNRQDDETIYEFANIENYVVCAKSRGTFAVLLTIPFDFPLPGTTGAYKYEMQEGAILLIRTTNEYASVAYIEGHIHPSAGQEKFTSQQVLERAAKTQRLKNISLATANRMGTQAFTGKYFLRNYVHCILSREELTDKLLETSKRNYGQVQQLHGIGVGPTATTWTMEWKGELRGATIDHGKRPKRGLRDPLPEPTKAWNTGNFGASQGSLTLAEALTAKGMMFRMGEKSLPPPAYSICQIHIEREKTNKMISRQCNVCLHDPISQQFWPCLHATCCSECAKNILMRNRKCPICRQKIAWSTFLPNRDPTDR